MVTPTTRAEFKEYVLRNKYSKWYFNIIEKATLRGWEKNKYFYTEKHHVIPRAITKEKISQGDVVYLTAKEHFICHLLLPKMIENKKIKGKMILALHRLITGNNKNYCLSSTTYELIKKQHSIVASERSKNYWDNIPKNNRTQMRSKEKNSCYGLIRTDETKRKQSESMKGKLAKEKHPLWKIGHSKESIEKMSKNAGKAALGKKWFNDGINNYLIDPKTNNNYKLGRIMQW